MPLSSDQRAPAPCLLPYLLGCAAAAIFIDLGSIHRDHTGDSLLPVIISLHRWTPFFWMQDRVGMLVPYLAMPIRHPLLNLLFQGALYLFSGLAAFYLLARYLLRDGTYPLVATLGAVAFLTLTPTLYRYDFFLNTFYGVWLMLGLGGLVLLEPRPDGFIPWYRCLAALGFLVLAHWAFNASALILGPLVLFRGLLTQWHPRQPGSCANGPRPWVTTLLAGLRKARHTETIVTLFLLAIAFGYGYELMEHADRITGHKPPPMKLGSIPATDWPHAWRQLVLNTWKALDPPVWPLFLVLASTMGLLLLAWPRVRLHARDPFRASAALAAASAVYGLFMGTREWLRMNSYEDRYWKPCVFFLQAALLILAVAPLCAALSASWRRRLQLLSGPALVLAAILSYGFPSYKSVRADVVQHRTAEGYLDMTQATADVLDAHCTHITGDYWLVWPLVFHANLVLYERGEDRTIWGVTFRSQSTRDLWEETPLEELRVALFPSDPMRDFYLAEYEFPPMLVIERRTAVWVLRPRILLDPALDMPGAFTPD